MKKALVLLLLSASLAAGAQNVAQIRRDASYMQAEGHAATLHSADSAALAGLAAKIAAQSGLSPAVGATYVRDLRQASSRLVEGRYTVLRYLRADRMRTVFEPRRERVRQLTARAEQSGDPQFYALAYVLAQSLPDFPPEQLENLRQRSSGRWEIEDFVSREADAVLAALRPPQVPEPDKRKAEMPKKANAAEPEPERVTVMDTVLVQRELGRIVVEHTFSRRDTLVLIPGGAKTAPEPEQRKEQRKERKAIRMQGFALVQAGICPDQTGGLMLGLGGSAWGGYAAVRSGFRAAPAADYECKSDGSTDYGQIWTTGQHRNSRLSLTGGFWYQAFNSVKVHVGAGYGKRTVCWEDTDGKWARVTDYSHAGLAIDAGVIWSYRHLCLSVGGEILGLRQWGLQVGAGVRF